MFFRAEDYQFYRRVIATAARRVGAEIWAYCLMPNHVRLIVTPAERNGLRRTLAKRTAARFGAVVMDESHLLAVAR